MAGDHTTPRPVFSEINPRQPLNPRLGLVKVQTFLTAWKTSGAVYGLVGAMLVCYLTDWKVVCNKIPYYRGKFKQE